MVTAKNKVEDAQDTGLIVYHENAPTARRLSRPIKSEGLSCSDHGGAASLWRRAREFERSRRGSRGRLSLIALEELGLLPEKCQKLSVFAPQLDLLERKVERYQ